MRKYYAMTKERKTADILIYGDITQFRWTESDVSGYSFTKELAALGELDEIVVHINSYGGEVSEGFAVYNTLRNHPAKVTTICDGFACSAASIIFMAGSRRIMNPLSALGIHNVQLCGGGDGNALRKMADEIDRLTEVAKTAYLSAGLAIDEDELKDMMDAESWIMPEDAVRMGFATEIAAQTAEGAPAQSARSSLFSLLREALRARNSQARDPDEDDPEKENPDKDDPGEGDSDEGDPDEDAPDEETPDEDDPDKDDPDEENPDEDDPDKDKPQKEKNAVQRWNGFFHALMNMQED